MRAPENWRMPADTEYVQASWIYRTAIARERECDDCWFKLTASKSYLVGHPVGILELEFSAPPQ